MKYFFVVTTATVLLPFGLMTAAWANDIQSDATQITPQAIESDSAPPATESTNRLDTIANQINRQVDGDEDDSQTTARPPGNPIGDLLNLPEGMVIRGSRGGVAVGTEL